MLISIRPHDVAAWVEKLQTKPIGKLCTSAKIGGCISLWPCHMFGLINE
jgi:hypothetical protein